MRMIIFTSHPIQYQVPLFRAIHSDPDIELLVVFSYIPDATEQGIGFGREIVWDTPLLDGYVSLVLSTAQTPFARNGFAKRVALELGSVIEKFSPDAALVLGWQELSLVQAYISCALRGIPIILRGESNGLRQRPAFIRFLHKLYFSLASSFIAIGDSNKNFYLQSGVASPKIAMAKYFVDNEHFSAKVAARIPMRETIRGRWGIQSNRMVVLFAGKLEAKKRVADVIRGCILAQSRGADLHLLIVGDGAEKVAAVEQAEVAGINYTFAGFLNQSEISDAYMVADCLVLPSDFGETWGLVANEAMASGLPVIVSDRVGCANDLVLEGSTGAVVPFNDADALASVLVRWNQEKERRMQLGITAKAHVETNYTVKLAAEAIKTAAFQARQAKRRE